MLDSDVFAQASVLFVFVQHNLAKLLERGRLDGISIAEVIGIYDVLGGNGDAAIRQAAQVGRAAGTRAAATRRRQDRMRPQPPARNTLK
ncbi:hypothetical protein A3L25_006035 [Pseudomonas putida]|uniref:Uncharacterized protein n=1 Tax=Pseudomonas putida TaxID=303 RepID=A0AAP9MUH7_PSEPU|nr:hypothetical protein A3L25_006035 [Pseudomonas putida]